MTSKTTSKHGYGTSQSTVIGNFGLSSKKARHDHQDVAAIAALFRTLLHQLMTTQIRVGKHVFCGKTVNVSASFVNQST